jgi:ADP-heptose:LPS heptosyltransferase
LLKICTKGYSILIHPTYSRNAYTDTLVHFIKAERKIGSEGELKVFIKWKGILIDQVYDQLVEADNEPMFEFLRNKNFIENIIDAPIVLERPRIDVTRIHIQRQISKPYAIIAPGASEATKMWPIKRFCELTAHLQNKYDLTIVVTGSKEEGKLADEILSYIKDNKALNLAGKVNLSGLAKIISECVILISNDTGTIHIGAAVDAKTVCITNGNRFGRFVPYPANIANNLCCVFPDEIYSPSIKIHNFTEMYRDRPISDITSVHFNMVKQTIDRILGV